VAEEKHIERGRSTTWAVIKGKRRCRQSREAKEDGTKHMISLIE